jgi:hypothetical protein
MDPYLKFAFLTGVSKFTKTSIFSELNNLYDITLTKIYANICGITLDDLDKCFGDHIRYLSTLEEFEQIDDLRNQILSWYDGYSWDGKTKLLNPFSLLSFFNQERFSAFWYASGTPKFLIDLIKKKPSSYTNLNNLKISEFMMDSTDIDNMSVELVLFQTGYLTIKDIVIKKVERSYLMCIPNYEVNVAFNLNIVSALTESDDTQVGIARMELSEALEAGDLQKMLGILRSLFASIPYQLHVDRESYYHSIFYAVMSVMGFELDVEVSVSKGRVDAVLALDDKVYVMEFKYYACPPDTSPEDKQKLFDKVLKEGMNQINEKEYHKKHIGGGKSIYLAAFAFLGRDDIEMRSVRL